jgi:hypothetical protein
MAGEFRFETDRSVAHGGAASGRIDCIKPAEREPAPHAGTVWGRWYQTDLPVKQGAAYRLTAWVMTSRDFAGTADIWLRSAQGGDGPGNRSVRVRSTHGIWQQVVFDDVVAGSDAAAVYLNLMGGVGSVWFDDIELTPR